MARRLIPREKYLEDALRFRDTDLVKVVTGVRRCGKSSLLELVRARLEEEGARGIVSVNLEDMGCGVSTAGDLYGLVRSRLAPEGRTYVFLDEVQRVEGWHDAVNSMRVAFDCDVYVTGSNAFLLSSEISTYLSGRYVEVRMLPLSFSEYAAFCGLSFEEGSDVGLDGRGRPVTFARAFGRYLDYGGMPAIASAETDQAAHSAYMGSLYDAVIVRDVARRSARRSPGPGLDEALLRTVCEYLADNVGNPTSPNRIAGVLSSSGRKVSHTTVRDYVRALEQAYAVYPAPRYDLHGKAILKTLPKYYVVDTGLRSYLSGYRSADAGRVFENAVFLQLLHEGWSVHVGKLYQREVDFVARKDGRTLYVQATDSMELESTRERELAPLLGLRDAHRKAVVVRQLDRSYDVDGVEVLAARDFFLA